MCLSVLLSMCLSLGVAQTKQTAVFMKQGRTTRVFCLVVHFNTHTHRHTYSYAHMHVHVHTPDALCSSSFTCPALLRFFPLVFFAVLSLFALFAPFAQRNACWLSDREECHSMWPLTYNKEGCWFRQGSEGAAAVMCPGLEGNTQTHAHWARLLAKIQTVVLFALM